MASEIPFLFFFSEIVVLKHLVTSAHFPPEERSGPVRVSSGSSEDEVVSEHQGGTQVTCQGRLTAPWVPQGGEAVGGRCLDDYTSAPWKLAGL